MYDQKFNYNAMVPVAVSEVKEVDCQGKTSDARKGVLGGGIYIHTAVHVAMHGQECYFLIIHSCYNICYKATYLHSYSHIILNEECRDCILLYVWQYACL